jgi:hypothetical protein
MQLRRSTSLRTGAVAFCGRFGGVFTADKGGHDIVSKI